MSEEGRVMSEEGRVMSEEWWVKREEWWVKNHPANGAMRQSDAVNVNITNFITFILRPNATLDYQTFHAEPQSLLSRRDIASEN